MIIQTACERSIDYFYKMMNKECVSGVFLLFIQIMKVLLTESLYIIV